MIESFQDSFPDPSEVHRELRVEIIRVARSARGSRQRLPDVVADEEMSVTNLQLREPRQRDAVDKVQLRADEAAVSRIHTVTRAGRRRRAAARAAAERVKHVL